MTATLFGRFYSRRAVALLLLSAPLLVLIATDACRASSKAKKKDYSRVRMSEKGLFKVTMKPEVDPIPLHEMHSWKINVQTKAGRPLTDASIAVEGGMPEHGHGLPTQPQVTQNLGNGDYLVEGLKFTMNGWWVVKFSITSGGRTDAATFNLQL